jgi:hypothetical protein
MSDMPARTFAGGADRVVRCRRVPKRIPSSRMMYRLVATATGTTRGYGMRHATNDPSRQVVEMPAVTLSPRRA